MWTGIDRDSGGRRSGGGGGGGRGGINNSGLRRVTDYIRYTVGFYIERLGRAGRGLMLPRGEQVEWR